MSEWLNEFTNWLRERDKKSERTQVSYEASLRIFAKWYEKSYRRPFAPRELTTNDVLGYRDELQQIRNLAASTVNVSLAALRALARWCIETGALKEDPAIQVNFIELITPEPRWMERSELRRLLAEFERTINDAKVRDASQRVRQGVRDKAAVCLMGGAGLRISEVTQLDLDDIDIRPRSGIVLVRNGKGNKQRTGHLGEVARRALTAWLEIRGRRPGPLFLSQKGGRIAVRQLQRSFAKHAHRAELMDRTPHSLRHTFVKDALRRTRDLPLVQRLAGHRSIQSTARYAAPSTEELAAAVEGALL